MTADPRALEALTAGIQSEVGAYVFYVEAIKIVTEADLKSVLEELALEEKKHYHILERRYDALMRSEMWVTTTDVLKQEGLPEINADMAAKYKDLIVKVKHSSSVREILEMALDLEQATVVLFKRLATEATTDDARKTFEQLTGFEEGHAGLIEDRLASLTD